MGSHAAWAAALAALNSGRLSKLSPADQAAKMRDIALDHGAMPCVAREIAGEPQRRERMRAKIQIYHVRPPAPPRHAIEGLAAMIERLLPR